MHAIITDGSISKYVNHPKPLVIGDVQYPARIFSVWTASELAAIGIILFIFFIGVIKDYFIDTFGFSFFVTPSKRKYIS